MVLDAEAQKPALINSVYGLLQNSKSLNVKQIRALQTGLNALGIDVGDVDGDVGSNTRKAVAEFLTQHPPVDGKFVSFKSIKSFKIADAVSPVFPIYGMLQGGGTLNKRDIRDLQSGLKALGIDVGKVDGVSGDRTRAAIAEFVTQNPPAEGQFISSHFIKFFKIPEAISSSLPVDVKRVNSIYSLLESPDPFNKEQIRDLQTNLSALGIDLGKVDGKTGSKTEGAIVEFLTKHPLVDGQFVSAQSIQFFKVPEAVSSSLETGDKNIPKNVNGAFDRATAAQEIVLPSPEEPLRVSKEEVTEILTEAEQKGDVVPKVVVGEEFVTVDTKMKGESYEEAASDEVVVLDKVAVSDEAVVSDEPVIVERTPKDVLIDAVASTLSGAGGYQLSNKADVKALQTAMNVHDERYEKAIAQSVVFAAGKADGIAGPKTHNALSRFFEVYGDDLTPELKAQGDRYLQEYDLVEKTMNSLIPRNNVSVKERQENLIALSQLTGNKALNPGGADGKAGSKTNAALAELKQLYENDSRFGRVMRQEAFEFGQGLSTPAVGFETNVNYGNRPFKQGNGNLHVSSVAFEGGWAYKGNTPMFGRQRQKKIKVKNPLGKLISKLVNREHDGNDLYPHKGGKDQKISNIGASEIVAKEAEYGGYGISTIMFNDRAEIKGDKRYRAVSVFKLYSHMNARADYKEGQVLSENSVIGTVGNTFGRQKGDGSYRRFARSAPHLHLEYMLRLERHDGSVKTVPVNPQILLGKDLAGPVLDITNPQNLSLLMKANHKSAIASDISNITLNQIKVWDKALEKYRKKSSQKVSALDGDNAEEKPEENPEDVASAGIAFDEVSSVEYSSLISKFSRKSALSFTPSDLAKVQIGVTSFVAPDLNALAAPGVLDVEMRQS